MKMPSSDFPMRINKRKREKESGQEEKMLKSSGASRDIFQSKGGKPFTLMQRNAQMHRQKIRRIFKKEKAEERANKKIGGNQLHARRPPPSLDRFLRIRDQQLEVGIPLLAFL